MKTLLVLMLWFCLVGCGKSDPKVTAQVAAQKQLDEIESAEKASQAEKNAADYEEFRQQLKLPELESEIAIAKALLQSQKDRLRQVAAGEILPTEAKILEQQEAAKENARRAKQLAAYRKQRGY